MICSGRRTCYSHRIDDGGDDQVGTRQIHDKNLADCSGIAAANGAAEGADDEQIAERADHRRQADDTNIVSSVGFADDEDVRSISELSMGPFCVTRSNPTHYKWKNLDPTRPNPIQLAMELTV